MILSEFFHEWNAIGQQEEEGGWEERGDDLERRLRLTKSVDCEISLWEHLSLLSQVIIKVQFKNIFIVRVNFEVMPLKRTKLLHN